MKIASDHLFFYAYYSICNLPICTLAHRPPPPQTILEALAACSPPLYLPAPLLRYVGKTFNCWHAALRLLEDRLEYAPDDEQCFDAVTDLYTQLRYSLALGQTRQRYSYAPHIGTKFI